MAIAAMKEAPAEVFSRQRGWMALQAVESQQKAKVMMPVSHAKEPQHHISTRSTASKDGADRLVLKKTLEGLARFCTNVLPRFDAAPFFHMQNDLNGDLARLTENMRPSGEKKNLFFSFLRSYP